MAGNSIGGKKAAAANKERHGDDFYSKIGTKGGSVKGVKKGFAANPDLARKVGARGGTISRRGKATQEG